MTKLYNEPEFKVVKTNTQDVLTSSAGTPTYTPGQFETGDVPFDNLLG
jgi:hypothetical protein